MPLYEYFCSACNSKFEMLRRLSQAGEGAVCPRCGNTAEKLLSTFCSMSKDSSGLTTPISGNSGCSSCGGGTCSTCGG